MQLQLKQQLEFLLPAFLIMIYIIPVLRRNLAVRKVKRTKERLKGFLVSVARTEGFITNRDFNVVDMPETMSASVLQELVESGVLVASTVDGAPRYSLSGREQVNWDDYVTRLGIHRSLVDSAKSFTYSLIEYCASNGMSVKPALLPKAIQFYVSPRVYRQIHPYTLEWRNGGLTLSVFIRNPHEDLAGWLWDKTRFYWYMIIDSANTDFETLGPVLRKAFDNASATPTQAGQSAR
ncbi:MAG: hypothetical protein HYY68_07545 [Thaumarchaeota archaeon]|nr:hypothetical protein [Nitrososphaerota archaeon]